MSFPPNPDGGNQPKSKLPPELAFLTQIPNFEKMEDEEVVAWTRNHLAALQKYAGLIRAHRMDPDAMIVSTTQKLQIFEKACQKEGEATEKMCQSIADTADAERALFKETAANVEKAYEQNPFDEKVLEAKKFVEEWSKRMPKE